MTSSTGLENVVLPIMPYTARELDRVLTESKSIHKDVQRVLLTDPAAAIALFRHLGQHRPEAWTSLTDTAHAVSMLGMERFKQMVAALPELDTGQRDDRPRRAFAYSQSAHAGHYAGAIAARKGRPADTATATAALLQQPAVLALWSADSNAAARATNVARDNVPIEIALHAELRESPADVNQRLAEAWFFPAAAREALGDFNPFSLQPQIVRLADGLAQATALDWNSGDTGTFVELLAEFFHVEHEAAEQWLHRQAVDTARELAGLDYPLSGYELMLLPEMEDFEIDHPVPEFGRREPAPTPAPAPVDLHGTLTEALESMRLDTGLERAFFLMLDKDKSRLRTRLAVGTADDDALRRLALPMANKHLFSLLMHKPQSLWLNTENQARYLPLLPQPLHPYLAEHGFFAMSLWARNRPIGLFLADGKSLDAQAYANFRAHCQRASTVLTEGSRAA